MRRDTAASGRLLAACSGGSLTHRCNSRLVRRTNFCACAQKCSHPPCTAKKKAPQGCFFLWRRRRDSNPRYGFIHTTPLAGEPLEPLGYFSKAISIISKRHALCQGFELFIFIKCAINCFIMLVSYGRM